MENCVAYIEYRCLTGFFNDQTMTGKVHGFFYVAERVSGDIPGLRRAMPHMTRSTNCKTAIGETVCPYVSHRRKLRARRDSFVARDAVQFSP